MNQPIQRGARIEVLDNLGAGPIREGVVTDINSGREGEPTVIYKDDSGKERWAYFPQIVDMFG